jgi:hypothetical protein
MQLSGSPVHDFMQGNVSHSHEVLRWHDDDFNAMVIYAIAMK